MTGFAELFSDYTFHTVAAGAAILGIISGVMGSFAAVRRQSLLGDGVSHAALPGVAAAFILSGSKSAEVLLSGAFISGILAVLIISVTVRFGRVKFDSALALVMSVFFGMGMVLLTYIQKIPNSTQAGLKQFIFGQASTLMERDIIVMSVCGIVLFVLIILFWKEFKLCAFDGDFAYVMGIPAGKLDVLMSLMLVISIIIGLQTVGVILMSAMLIAPAAAARQWSRGFWGMTVLSALFGALSGVMGTAASSVFEKVPTGPAIVIFASAIAGVSILFAPGRGALRWIYRRGRNRIVYKIEGRDSYDAAD